MDKGFKILDDSVKGTIKNLQFVSERISGNEGLIINSVIETLQAQSKVIEFLNNRFETENGIKNKCFDFLVSKGLYEEFYSK